MTTVLFYRQAPCERAAPSAASAASQSGRPIAILVQPTPQGVPALSHQIRHQPSSKRTSAKSARAGETVKPMARTPKAKISRFIADLLLRKFKLRRGGEIAEPLQVLFLLVVARRQLEQARRRAAENIVLGLLRQERQVPDRRRQVEIPMRIVRRIEELRLGIHHAERALHRVVVLNLHRLR